VNIAFIRRNWSSTGGAENYLIRLVRKLRDQGCQATLLCETWNRPSEPFDQVVTLPVRGPAFRKPAAFAQATNTYIASHLFDLVFSMERGIKSDIYRAGDGVHRVWLRHRQEASGISGRFQNLLNPKNFTQLHLEKMTFQPAMTRCVIANSTMVKQDILTCFDYPESRITTILNGVDVAFFSSGNRQKGRAALNLSPDLFTALLVGSGAERKGHAAARQVMDRWKNRAQLVVIDSPPPCSLPDVYAAADVFLFPTLYDPFANVTLEAMAAGLPVITTEANGAHELIDHGKNGFVVTNNRQQEALSAHIHALMEPGLRADMGAASRATAAEWTLEKNVASTLGLMERLAQNTAD
jgi:UDP-glucose:(heptosyl)LPS alpha-1,3-glucosyltransferase